jgi:Centromere/kinetochore Zw10.
MKRITVLLILVCILVASCSSPKKEAQELKEQADEHYNHQELQSAVATYEKSLELHEDPEARSSYQKALDELNSVNEVKDIIRNFQELHTKLLHSSNDRELVEVVKDIDLDFNKLKNIKSPTSTTINNVINSLKTDGVYTSFNLELALILSRLQFGTGEADIAKFSDLLLEVIDKLNFLDNAYK